MMGPDPWDPFANHGHTWESKIPGPVERPEWEVALCNDDEHPNQCGYDGAGWEPVTAVVGPHTSTYQGRIFVVWRRMK